MCGLIIYTHKYINGAFLTFFTSCLVIGFVAEAIGTSTGALFGSYIYGNALGPGIRNVPVVVGVNWFIIIYCSGVSVQMLLNSLIKKVGEGEITRSPVVRTLSVIIDGATLATLFDVFLEPAAIKLGYWQWMDGGVPWFNYTCWFLLSAGLLTIFHFSTFYKHNNFAVNLLLIQVMFFLVVHTFL